MDWSKVLIEHESLVEHPESAGGREMTQAGAVRDALDTILGQDADFFVMGQGVDDPDGMFGITRDLHRKHGPKRVFDTPLSENALTGVAVGAAVTGMRPFYMHNRPDFLMLAMDQIVNHASKWSYMFAGKVKVPLVIWAAVGRGWGGAAQHTQNLHGIFMHVPGLRLVMPSTPYDAKGLVVSSIADNNPVLIFEHRWLLRQKGLVPEELYSIPFGKGVVRRPGKDVTVVAVSYMNLEAMRAADELAKEGIDIEVIDPRTLKPLDEALITASVKKTGRLVIADTGWKTGGVGAEMIARLAEQGLDCLKAPIRRVSSPDVPTPASHVLEAKFYADKDDIIRSVRELTGSMKTRSGVNEG